MKPEKQEAAAASSPEKLPAQEPSGQPDLPAPAQSAPDKAGDVPGERSSTFAGSPPPGL